MNIELRKLKIALHMSEETTAFTADIYIDGINAGYAKNDGHGGCTFYHPNAKPECRVLIQRAETHCSKMPPIQLGTRSIPMTLEDFIDDIVYKELERRDAEKIKKTIEKKQKNHIMWGQPDFKGSYNQLKFPQPLSAYTKEVIQQTIDKYKPQLKAGEVFWNTNLQEMGIKF